MLQVGQKLWYVPRQRGNPHEIEIKEVGRKWAKFGYRDRVDMQTLMVDGGEYISPGKCYLSKDDYEHKMEIKKAWDNLINDMRFIKCPNDITVDEINHVRETLKL